jgi:methylenetetrahydrofolate reductase (NADPH)
MKLTDIWSTKKKPTISFEVFPARSPKQAGNLEKALDKLATLNPDFFSVTFGAGGSTREGSYQLIEKLKNQKNMEVLGYFACYGLGPEDITAVLDSYRDLGIENILAVRGDEPRDDENFKPHEQSMPHATDLIEFIRPKYDFCVGGAGYPEGHIQAKSREKDLEYLKLKVEKGAEYIITNYCYDNKYFFDFLERCREAGITVPILPGVMPVYSVKMMHALAGLCGATITDKLKAGLDAIDMEDKEAVLNFGIDFAYEQCKGLLETGVIGIHFYTMDRSKSVNEIITRLRNDGLF